MKDIGWLLDDNNNNKHKVLKQETKIMHVLDKYVI